MSVYVDDAFDQLPVPAKWSGGGHLQADSLDELHAFAVSIGLRREWFQTRPGRPDCDHYDLTASKRTLAIERGAIAEVAEEGVTRRRRIRQEQRAGSRES